MKLKTTNIRKKYHSPYAEMIRCSEDESILDTVSAYGQDPGTGGGGGNEELNGEFAKGVYIGVWDDVNTNGENDISATIFDY